MICIGDLVESPITGKRGVVDYIYRYGNRMVCDVETDRGLQRYYKAGLVNVCCRNCGYGKSTHTESGKCIYGPGNWEAA